MQGVNQTTAKMQESRADEMDSDLVETTAHAGARPSHAEWQGKVFSRSGKDKKYPKFVENTGYGTAGGLCGVNCRHSFYPFFEDISERAYTDDEIEKYNEKNITYDGKQYSEYEVTQIQRSLERNIRADKRQIIAKQGAILGTKEDDLKETLKLEMSKSSVILKQDEIKLKHFIEQTKLTKESSREQIASWNKSISRNTVISRETLENRAKILYNLDTGEQNIKAYLKDETIRKNILSNNMSKVLNVDKQNKHILGTKEYKDGKSYLTIDNEKVQKLVNKYVGTGKMERDKNDNFVHKEFNSADYNIGVSINKDTKVETITNKFYIHYSKTGVHIVPTIKGE
ncbi:MAG: phage minor capsid protein [Clostridia bacterium]